MELPKRSQIARLFFPSGESRISLIGAISVPVDYKMENVRITYPSDAEFFGTLLHQAPSYPYWDLRSKLTYPVAYKYSRLSDKGRYLQGVLGMFQSLGSAHDVLMCHFWRNQLTKLAIPSQEQRPALIERLKKRLRSQASKVHIETEANWDRLARAVEREVNTLRSPRHTVQLKVLLDEWREELSAAIDADNNLKSRKVELLAEADSELKSSLDSLTRLGVFHQGYDWHCPHCGYRNWNAIDSLRAALACQVCHQERHIPVDLVLDFRLNEFFATCLREHDTLTMIWALGQLQRDAKASFIFTPQIDLFRKYPESRASTNDRELDLLCVVDGKVIIGEVKTSLSEIDSAEVDSLVELANELKPDIVIVAAMMGDREIMVEKLGQIRSRIPTNIEVKDLLSSNSDTELSLYLP